MTSSFSRLLLFVCGIYLQMKGCLLLDHSSQLIIRNMTSWLEAHNNPPNTSYELISPFLAVNLVPEIRNLTDGPIYVNGFTLGVLDGGGVVIQLSNKSEQYDIYCVNEEGYQKPSGKYSFKAGNDFCENINLNYPTDASFVGNVGLTFMKTVFWLNGDFVPKLFSKNETKHCMILDLQGNGQLMLENCSRTHEAVYIQDRYQQTVKKYTSSSHYPFYDPDRNNQGGISTGTESTSASTFSTERKSSQTSTNQRNGITTGAPDSTKPGTKDNSKGLFGMNPDITYALIGVGSVVIVVVVICLFCCCLCRRKDVTPRRTALSDDYSNPVDSIGMKDVEMNRNSNNGVYANPQDSINPVKAKKRDSIGEGVYDVTFTSGQRKPNVNPNQQANAYAHVTIQPQGGAQVDDTENHYDSTAYVKPQPTVFVSPTHSEGTYGEVQIKSET